MVFTVFSNYLLNTAEWNCFICIIGCEAGGMMCQQRLNEMLLMVLKSSSLTCKPHKTQLNKKSL